MSLKILVITNFLSSSFKKKFKKKIKSDKNKKSKKDKNHKKKEKDGLEEFLECTNNYEVL